MSNRTSLRMRVLPRFPARIVGTDGIKVEQESNGAADLIVRSAFDQLADITAVPDPATNYFMMYDAVNDYYRRIPFQGMFDSAGVSAGFPTIDAAEAANIPVVVHAIEVYGSATVGDGLGGLYIDTNNGASETFISGDGRTWYLAADVNPDRLTAATIALFATSAQGALADKAALCYVSRAALVVDLTYAQLRPDGAIITAGKLAYQRVTASTVIPDLPGFEPFFAPAIGPNAGHWGFVGNGTKADTDKANLGLAWLGTIGGGTLFIVTPGEYLLANTNVYNPADWGGIPEINTSWWANRRALWIKNNNVSLHLCPGVKLKIGNGQNCHAIQIGQFDLIINAVPIPSISVSDVSVVAYGAQIDMNGANQTAATDTKDHAAGIMVFTGSKRVNLFGGWVYGSTYYCVGFESTTTVTLGYEECNIRDMLLSECKADAFDTKDYSTLSKGNTIERVRVLNFGSGGDDFLSPQAGIDVRGGWRVLNCDVRVTDAFTGARVGIRTQYATDFAESVNPSIIENCNVLGNGRNAETICYRTSGKGSRVINSQGKGMSEGLRTSTPNTVHTGNTMWDCDFDYRLLADGTAGWDADNTQLIGCIGRNSTTAFRVDAGVSGAKIIGGEALTVTTALVDSGTGTVARDVTGLLTYNKVSLAVPLDVTTTGRKTFSINHGLPFTPAATDVQLQGVRSAFDANLDWTSLMVTGTSSSQISGELRVVVAGAALLTLQVTATIGIKNL